MEPESSHSRNQFFVWPRSRWFTWPSKQILSCGGTQTLGRNLKRLSSHPHAAQPLNHDGPWQPKKEIIRLQEHFPLTLAGASLQDRISRTAKCCLCLCFTGAGDRSTPPPRRSDTLCAQQFKQLCSNSTDPAVATSRAPRLAQSSRSLPVLFDALPASNGIPNRVRVWATIPGFPVAHISKLKKMVV